MAPGLVYKQPRGSVFHQSIKQKSFLHYFTMNIVVNNLSYVLPDGISVFSNISFAIFSRSKCALVGANGCGKSSLLNILAGQIKPTEGEMSFGDIPYLVPQHYGQFNHMTVGEVLGVSDKIEALQAILSGDSSESSFDILRDDWSIEDRVRVALDSWGLYDVRCDFQFKGLSGGEKTKVFLAGIMLHNPRIVLMDEPTNHLDDDSRGVLYEFMDNFNGTMLVVSHDVMLLNRFSKIYELSEKGMRMYPMRFDEYRESVAAENISLAEHVDCLRKELRKQKLIARETAERQQRQNSRGRSHSEKKCVARISMGNLKNQAEKSTAKSAYIQCNKIDSLTERIADASSRINDVGRMAVDFSSPDVHVGKIMIEAHGIDFAYPRENGLWEKRLDFIIRSGDRICVTGRNGSGKSTLMKIIKGELAPTIGSVYRADNLRCVYLDQEYSLIDNNITISEQIQNFNRHSLPEHELNIRLNRFLFSESSWNKPCAVLSGGEKMRLSLCCLMVADDTPDMIIADEPTNNLDLYNIEVLSSVLRMYSGTLIVISHDVVFSNRLMLSQKIIL